MTLLVLNHPVSGEPLTADTSHSLAGAGDRWPVCDGIPYLRAGRDDLRREALRKLDTGDADGGLAVLLTDQDPFAPLPPPAVGECRAVVRDVRAGACSLREAMRRLNFGPVADYFAHRTCTPTFLSGLGLLARHGRSAGPVVELACGIGQFLRELTTRGVPAAGVDLVFAKLWLARRFVAPRAELVCGDAVRPPVAAPDGATVFCHDAFYFFPDKPAAATNFIRLAGSGGRVLVGHAHNAGWDHGGVAGNLLTPRGYADLFPGCVVYDDAELAASALAQTPAQARDPGELAAVEAVALAWADGGPPQGRLWDDLLLPPPGTPLRPNPLLRERAGRLEPAWPSTRFAAEYRAATYLTGPPVPPRLTRLAAGGTGRDPDVDALARRRVLLDLPEGW